MPSAFRKVKEFSIHLGYRDAGGPPGRPALAMSLPRLCFETILPGCLAARGRRVIGVDRMDRIDGMGLGGEE